MALNAATPSAANLKVTHLLVSLPFMWMRNKAGTLFNKESAAERGSVEALVKLAAIFLRLCVILFLGMKNISTERPLEVAAIFRKRPFF